MSEMDEQLFRAYGPALSLDELMKAVMARVEDNMQRLEIEFDSHHMLPLTEEQKWTIRRYLMGQGANTAMNMSVLLRAGVDISAMASVTKEDIDKWLESHGI